MYKQSICAGQLIINQSEYRALKVKSYTIPHLSMKCQEITVQSDGYSILSSCRGNKETGHMLLAQYSLMKNEGSRP